MLIVYDEKTKTKSVYCARVRGHVIVPTHLLKMQFNMLKSVVAHLLEHGEQLHFFGMPC